MLGVGKRHIRGYLGLLVGCLAIALYIVSTVFVGWFKTYLMFPIALALVAMIYYFFRDRLRGSNKPRRKAVMRSSYSIPEDEIIPIQSDDSSWAGKIFLGYVLIATFVLLPLCLLMAWRGLDFASQFAWICFLGSIGFLFLLLIAIGVNIFIKGQFEEHSYRDDHNPHLREWKEKLRERK